MKKTLARLLCVFLAMGILVCLAACDSSESDTSSSSSGAGSLSESGNEAAEYQDADGSYIPKIGVLDQYKGQTFSILVVGESQTTYQSDDFTTQAGSGGIDYGDAYYTEVQARNDKIEELYDVKLEVYKENDFVNAAREDAISGTQLYDAMILTVTTMTALAQDDYLCDLRSLSNFDADAPWWDASANEAYSVGGKLYFTTGDITIMNKANTWSILFNKDMISDNNLESPYDLFYNGTWTFDKMCEMAQQANTATISSDWSDPNVNFGMVTAYGDILQFYGGSGMTLCEKDAEDHPLLSFGSSDASINLTQKILETLNEAQWKIYAQELTNTSDVWTDSFKVFYTGRALFRPSGFTATTKLRSLAEMEFGIVPMPKMTEDQEEYWTVTNGTFVAGILKNCRDPEYSAYMLDAYAAGAKNYITDAYIEVNLKWKSLRDDESAEVLEYIFDHIIYDVGMVYDFGNISTMFSELAKDHSADVVSKLDSIRQAVETEIEQVILDYTQNG